MYNLKTTKVSFSLYELVPIFLFVWGLVLVLYIYLAPQFILVSSVFIAFIASVALFTFYKWKGVTGYIFIQGNKAFLLQASGQKLELEFLTFNGWRLVAKIKPSVEEKSSSRLLNHNPKICVYHTAIEREDYNYLRSFAAYQCFMKTSSDSETKPF